jgi:hypothetical protein
MIVTVLCAGTLINGRTFHPRPKSEAAAENARSGFVESGDRMAPFPLSPVGFSGDTMRVFRSGVSIGSETTSPLVIELLVWASAADPSHTTLAANAIRVNSELILRLTMNTCPCSLTCDCLIGTPDKGLPWDVSMVLPIRVTLLFPFFTSP